MYELILIIVFIIIFLLDKFRVMQTVNFMCVAILYIITDIYLTAGISSIIINEVTFKIVCLLSIVISCMFIVQNYFNEG